MHRRNFLLAGLGGAAALAAGVAPANAAPAQAANLGLLLYSYGIRAKAQKDQDFSDPIRFLQFGHERGANAVQLPLGMRSPAESLAIRQATDKLNMSVEGIVSPPNETAAELDRFTAELSTAAACGANVVRLVLLGGRRYEVFEKADDYRAFAQRAEAALHRIEPIARDKRVVIAVENHKDFRVDEQIDLLKRISSEWIGVCLDTGNNLALLEEPHAVVESLAPFARSVHLKDIGVEDAPDGFRMSEVPLGKGCLDLSRIVSTIQKASPKARFHLEMITRDPLSIPCLTEKYWATFGRVPGLDLARTLTRVRADAGQTPLPRIAKLTNENQLLLEDQHVRDSFEYAVRTGLVAAS
jgi:sugar phosphate isomerase/epimerase